MLTPLINLLARKFASPSATGPTSNRSSANHYQTAGNTAQSACRNSKGDANRTRRWASKGHS